jgi:hypothetical protein
MQTKGFEPLAPAWKASDLAVNRYLLFSLACFPYSIYANIIITIIE